jgi:hypothetical protein
MGSKPAASGLFGRAAVEMPRATDNHPRVVTLMDERPLATVFPQIRDLPGVPWDLLPALRAPLELRGWTSWDSIGVRSPRDLATLKYVTPHRAAEFLEAVANACCADSSKQASCAVVGWPPDGTGDASPDARSGKRDDGTSEPTPDVAAGRAGATQCEPALRSVLSVAALLTRRLQRSLGDEKFERGASEVLADPAKPRTDHHAGPPWIAPANVDAWRHVDSVFAGCPKPVIRGRLFPEGKPTTLAIVGDELGITRERVRQIESRFRERFNDAITLQLELTPIVRLAVELRCQLEPILEPQHLDDALQAAFVASGGAHGDDLTVRIRRGVLRELLGQFNEQDGFLVDADAFPTLDAWRRRLRDSEAGELLPCDLGEVVAGEIGIVSASGADSIERLLRLRRVGQHLVRWNVGLGDKGVAILREAGRALTPDEIHEGVGYDANPRSLLNAVSSDPRVVRVGKNLYGLRVWGLEEYSGIRAEIEEAIERAGGSVGLEELVAELVKQFNVSETSVRAYAADRQFIRRPDGSLAMRSADDPEPSYRYERPEDTPALVLLEGVWHLRVTVDFDLLRGSGRAIRNGTALVAGLEPDLTLGFRCDGRDVVMSWARKQPTIGSLRGLAQHHGVIEGDFLLLPLEGAQERRARVVRAHDLARASALESLQMLLGADPATDPVDAARVCANALGLPPSADLQDVADLLRDRGERSLCELLREDV